MRPARVLGLVLGLLLAAGPTAATAVDVDLQLGGGSVMAWDSPDQVGNAFGLGLFLHVGDFAIGLAGAAVLPDSRVQGEFAAVWVEGRWYPFHLDIPLSPYALAGVGLATGDGFHARADVIPPARWVTGGTSPLGTVGIGARFGDPEGMQLAVDVRLYNHTHGGVNVTAGYMF